MKPMTGKEFKAARLKMGYTPQQLGKKMKSSPSTIYSWEDGTYPISMWVALAMKYLLLESRKK